MELDILEDMFKLTPNTDRLVRLVAGVAMALSGHMTATPDVKAVVDDCASKAIAARQLIHLANTPGQLRGVIEAKGDVSKLIVHCSMLGFLLNEHMLFVASLKPTALLGLDAPSWLKRNAMCMNVFFTFNLLRTAQALSKSASAYATQQKDEHLQAALDAALQMAIFFLDLLITLSRSGVKPIITTVRCFLLFACDPHAHAWRFFRGSRVDAGAQVGQMGQIGIFNALAGLYLEYRRCVVFPCAEMRLTRMEQALPASSWRLKRQRRPHEKWPGGHV